MLFYQAEYRKLLSKLMIVSSQQRTTTERHLVMPLSLANTEVSCGSLAASLALEPSHSGTACLVYP